MQQNSNGSGPDTDLDITLVIKKGDFKIVKTYGIIDLGLMVHVECGKIIRFGNYSICEIIGENIYMVTIPCGKVNIPLISTSVGYLKKIMDYDHETLITLPIMKIPTHFKRDKIFLSAR